MLEWEEEIETPQKIELPQEWSHIEEAKTVENEQVMMIAEKKEGLLNMEQSYEQKGWKRTRRELIE